MSLKKKCLILWSALICATALPISATEVTDNPFAKPTSSQQPSAPKPPDPPYPYGYTKAELSSVPRIEISGYKNPELIPEYMAWRAFFSSFVSFYENSIEDLWYIIQRKMPTITRAQMQTLIVISRESLDGQRLITEELGDDKRTLCRTIIGEVEKGKKLSNVQVKKMIKESERKLPDFFEKVKTRIKTELSPQAFTVLERYMNKNIRVGISYSQLDINGWANLRKHNYSYSDVYEGFLCSHINR